MRWKIKVAPRDPDRYRRGWHLFRPFFPRLVGKERVVGEWIERRLIDRNILGFPTWEYRERSRGPLAPMPPCEPLPVFRSRFVLPMTEAEIEELMTQYPDPLAPEELPPC